MTDHLSPLTYQTRDGERFAYEAWLPEGEPRGVMVAFHGLSGASDDFEPLGESLSQQGWAVYAPNLRSQGHDPRPERRGNHGNFEVLVDDFEDFTAYVSRQHPGQPIIETGESMGAMLLIHRHARAAKPEPQVRAIVLLAPVVDLKFEVQPWQRLLFKTLTTVAPGYRAKVDNYADRQPEKPRMTRDDAYQRRLDEADHRLPELSLRFVGGLTRAIERAPKAATRVELPVYVAYGGHDIFIAPHQVEAFAEKIGSRDLTLRLYPESYHLLLHDYDAEQVMEELQPWLEKQIAQ